MSLGDEKYAEERFDPKDPEAFALYEAASDYLILGRENDSLDRPRYMHSGIWAPTTWRDIVGGHNWRSPSMHALARGFSVFTQNTRQNGEGEALDLIGPNNVIFYPTTPEIPETDFKLVDALYPFPGLTMKQISDLLLRVNENSMPELTSAEKAKLMNGVNYLRIANAIIAFSESDVGFLNPFPEGVSWRPDIWRRVYTLSREFLYEKGRVDSVPNVF